MLILKDKEFIEYENNLYNNKGKISFSQGELITIDPQVAYIVPGFIDQHIHGCSGIDTMDANLKGLATFANDLTKEGTTGFLATTMTCDVNDIKQAIACVKEYQAINKGAEIYGIHLEGPFISNHFIGAQNPQYVLKPNIALFESLNQDNLIKLVTYAPEEDADFLFTKYLKNHHIIPSVGHSNASCECVNKAIEYGLANFTHFHNASSKHDHRNPGVVSSGLLNKDINVELIVDGVHLHPDVVRLVYNIKGYQHISLITDAMRAKAMPDGVYDLGGQAVYKKGNEARLEDNTLAGSVLKMNDAVKNMYHFSKCPLNEAFLMASYTPAKLLNLDKVGLIKEGYRFNITMLDQDFNVIATYVNGHQIA